MKRDFLMVSDLSTSELTDVLALAASLKLDRRAHDDALAGRSVGIFFEHPSTRTRVSSEVAIVELGAHPVTLRGEEVGIARREAPSDVGRVLERYVDLIAMRVAGHSTLQAIAAAADRVPVVNLLSDRSHPCQVLADLQTIAEHRSLPGTRLAYLGDGNNVSHSLLLGGAMAGMDVVIAAPDGFGPDAAIFAQATELARPSGGSVAVVDDPRSAVANCDVVYTDVWTSMGQEAEQQQRLQAFAGFEVDEDLFELADADAMFLHCLPAHRGEEVSAAMMEHERSLVFDQAENRLHAFKALLLFLLAGPR